jgi:adenylate cyclase, class 2
MHINIECKVKAQNITLLQEKLKSLNPLYKGLDHQIDTYFNTNTGRLKLREGTIENALIHYVRSNTADAKQSDVLLYQHQPNATLKQILTTVNGVKVIVDKQRHIYFVDNVKLHFDTVAQLGTFVEIEAIQMEPHHTIQSLQEQCNWFINFLEIKPTDFIAQSYSDLILQIENL